MRKIGEMTEKALVVSGGSRQASASDNATLLWKRRTREPMPTLTNGDVDVRMPNQLWSAWKETGKPRLLRRPLNDAERRLLELRRDELAPWVAGYHDAERADVIALIGEMFNSFPSMSAKNDKFAASYMDALSRKLQRFPKWAIEHVCVQIGIRGYTKKTDEGRYVQERHWPPSDPELIDMIEAEVRVVDHNFVSAVALLAAGAEK